MTATADRPRVDVAGAGAVLDALAAESATAPPGVAAARALERVPVDWAAARQVAVESGRSVVVAGAAGGPVVAVKHLAPGERTSIHDHGAAGAALVVEGTCRYERFARRTATTAALESSHQPAAGDVHWWGEPPDDLHRQAAGLDGVLVAVVVGPGHRAGIEFADATPPSSPLRAAVEQAWLDGDATVLDPWYADDVLGDLNVPRWRFQARGRDALLGMLVTEEWAEPGRRLAALRVTEIDGGLLVETEQRSDAAGSSKVREAHVLRCRGGLVVEHTVWCTGVVDAAAATSQFRTAPMERM